MKNNSEILMARNGRLGGQNVTVSLNSKLKTSQLKTSKKYLKGVAPLLNVHSMIRLYLKEYLKYQS